MNRKKLILTVLTTLSTAFLVIGCNTGGQSATSTGNGTERPEGWTDETHGNDADPNYEIVFPQDEVNQIKITIDPDDWEAMQADMTVLYGEKGTETLRPDGVLPDDGMPDDRMLPGSDNVTPFRRPERGGGFPGGKEQSPDSDAGNLPDGEADIAPERDAGNLPGWVDMTSENPTWVPATIEFNGLTWTKVGIRYKGNSSLTSAWRNGMLKMPFKLDFDEFEDEYPEIDNQRFYGFKQLSFSNAFSDSTYMRDALAADILNDSGLAAAETAWYEVILDYGEGPVSLGLYVVVEVIDDTVIDRCFEDDSGNIYEGDGRGVSLAEGTYGQIKDSFLKENNEQEADWSDIEELYEVLHSDSRISNPEEWKKDLESIFDVDSFLKWLAISAVIQHWDSYGSMTHNFYLYNDPESGQLTWISWDHNQVLAGEGPAGGRRGRVVAGILPGRNLSLGREEVTDQWPLIRYLLDEPAYYSQYLDYMEETISTVFNPDILKETCQEMAEIISPYITGDEQDSFETAVQALIDRIYERYQVTTTFLESGG